MYVITAAGKVEEFRTVSGATARVTELGGEGKAWMVGSQKALATVPTAVLVLVYNVAASESESKAKTITKFADREAAERRTWPVVEYLAKPGKEPEGSTTGGTKSKGGSTGGGLRGRPSDYAGKTIHLLVKENPRREGTAGHKRFALMKDRMSYEDFLKAGGRSKDLRWDVDHKHVEVK